MLSGDNSILQKATQAKENTERTQIIENARLDILAGITDKKGNDLTADEIKEILGIYFTSNTIPEDLTDLTQEMTTKSGAYKVKLSEVLNGANIASPTQTVATIGEEYRPNWIGKTIEYSANGVSDWIILGQDKNKNVLITTVNPVGSQEIHFGLTSWASYEGTLNSTCEDYAGTIGTGNKSYETTARSITLTDINKAVGFKETINGVTLGGAANNYAYPNSNYTGWVTKYTDENQTILNTNYSSWISSDYGVSEAYFYYNDNGTYKFGSVTNGFSEATITLDSSLASNMYYIFANGTPYLVASRSIYMTPTLAWFNVAVVAEGIVACGNELCYCTSDTIQGYTSDVEDDDIPALALRPVVVLSSDIPYDDVKDDIGATYVYE